MNNLRGVVEQIRAKPASDGDGVKLLRVFGGQGPERFDPFLMLDEFGSQQASDYIGGFPSHPHRGFQTVTYMLQGKMEHKDHMGNIGLIDGGDVQWMNAGSGVIHSEMPRQTEGKMRGFQLWVNLPAEKKMAPADYKEGKAQDIPVYQHPDYCIKAIAGSVELEGEQLKGYFAIEDTDVLFLDIHLQPQAKLELPVPEAYHSLVYTYEGEVSLGAAEVQAQSQTLSRFDGAGAVAIENTAQEISRVLLLAGKPLKQPIVQYGPFVMNTVAEIEQAIADYQAGQLTA
ncbi:hypothetical protein SAMN02745866_01562 [Alteromonadaceae bacterium Bs31]|nr:hypothetical protein SAMN02745866_01562 [Alteromonadaceae bacterium Bs31]